MKKILFSILGLFTLFLINTNVYAAPNAMEFLYTSESDYLELIDNFETNYLNNYLDVIDFDWTFNNKILISRTIWKNGELEKNYHLLFYDEITNQTYNKNNKSFQLNCKNFMDVILDENGNILSLFDGRGINTMAGYFMFSIDNLLYENTFQQHYSYNIVYSNIGFVLYSDYSNKNELVLFYDPLNNFSKNITYEDLTTDLDDKYNDYVGSTGENLSWFEKILNKIIAIPVAIGNILKNFFNDLVQGILNGLKDLLIPDLEFLKSGFNHFMQVLEEKLGFVFQTFDLVFDILNRFINLNDNNHIINIPAIKEPFSGITIYEGTTFNFDLFLEQNNISYLHTIYLWFVDALVAIAFIHQGLRIFDLVTTGLGFSENYDLFLEDTNSLSNRAKRAQKGRR